MPRLGILGTFVWDRIHPAPDGHGATVPVLEDWGGIIYSLEAFAAARSDWWTCLPIAKVGADRMDGVTERVSGMAGVDSTAGLVGVPEDNNLVDLFYHDRQDRCERLQGGVPGWEWDELEPLVESCDALYVNFIAGWEIDLPTARRLRRQFDGPIYCDIHSLLLGTDAEGVRVRRQLDDWPEWNACFDIVQGNRDEIRIVTGGIEAPLAAVRALAEAGAEAAFSTLGPDGVAWAAPPDSPWLSMGREDEAPVRRATVARISPPKRAIPTVDATGCGDVWGAACFISMLAGIPLPEAVERANRFAAGAAARRGSAGLADALCRRSA